MAKQTTDRRVARTRAMLQQALISLILRKDYEAITVEDICEAANVGRSTFYTHYAGKDDLKRSGLDAHLRALLAERQRAASEAGEGSLRFSLAMFEHARDHKDLYRALSGGRGGAVSRDAIRKVLSDLVRDELSASGVGKTTDAVPRELAVRFVVGAWMAVLDWWLDGGARLSPEKIDAMFRRMVARGVMS